MAEPTPGSSPNRQTFDAIDFRTGPAFAKAVEEPEAMRVISPDRAFAGPPLVGASRKWRPVTSRRRARSRVLSGGKVAHDTRTVSGRMLCAAPSSPKTTASVCRASTTTEMTTSARQQACRTPASKRPPISSSSSRRSGTISTPTTACPSRSSEAAIPIPIDPRPMTVTCMVLSS